MADEDHAIVAAFAAVRPGRTAAVLVPVIERDEPLPIRAAALR